jgi:NADPH-dependent glutamate synthase beta subunit-like oxidoreductase
MEDRRPKRSDQPNFEEMETGVLGNLKVDWEYKLPRPGWYAAGEAATGAATVVDSMATGRIAAQIVAADLEKKREAR